MTRYDYKVVPAPVQGRKARGVKGAESRFAFALECVMNDLAGDGWEYVRAETLPSEERQGLSGRTTVFRNLLVFRRPREDEVEAFAPRLLDPPKEIPVLDAARALKADDGRDARSGQDARFEEGEAKAVPEAAGSDAPEDAVGTEDAAVEQDREAPSKS
ncbi:DUF4177 domain-containing protein [Marinovum sp.]|uniref:DUF4177 domain-containing protein n=1 Tax=Marinovum sp. TaxID=2024839 RepID=UPI002B27BA92|nr:DUF4177 domain-containing protein [Marinovum sp.]